MGPPGFNQYGPPPPMFYLHLLALLPLVNTPPPPPPLPLHTHIHAQRDMSRLWITCPAQTGTLPCRGELAICNQNTYPAYDSQLLIVASPVSRWQH